MAGLSLICLGVSSLPQSAYAVVGQAEEYDYFEQQKLNEFHENLVNEEQQKQFAQADAMRDQLKQASANLKSSDESEKQALDAEIENLKKELLTLPKRDRFQLEIVGSQTFDSNANRAPINSEKNDSMFDSGANIVFDLSGKKTDLRADTGIVKEWSVEFPEKDTIQYQETIRYRRRYFRKISQSSQSRFLRHNSKTVEIDSEKVRYDSSQNTSFNYTMTPRFSINNDFNMTHRYFPQEAFDQDSSFEVGAAPSLFWNVTPKSRFSLGYRLAGNRIRTKTGDTNSHEIHAGYFGRITKKSSTSIDLAFQHQIPKSQGGATINGVTSGLGYIWQMTPKTQFLIQYITSYQNSTSNATSGIDAAATADTPVTKTSTRFLNNSVSLSLNARLNRKLTAVLNLNPYFTLNYNDAPGSDPKSASYGLPVSIGLTYIVKRWLTLNTGYTFSYRTGDEHADRSRVNTWKNSARLVF